MAAEGVGDGNMATVEYRIARGGHDEMIANGAWLAGEEIESSAARRQPLTFEVGSKMVLPVLDHAVRRLALGAETGAACTCAPASDAYRLFVGALLGSMSQSAPLLTGACAATHPAAVATTAQDAFGADWCSANGVPLHEEIVVAVRLLGVSWPYEDLEKVPAVARAGSSRAHSSG